MARVTSKVRRIVFDTNNDEHKLYFAMLYHGFVTGGSVEGARASKSMDVFRRESRILDKLEAVATAPSPEAESVTWTERTNEIVLDQAEFDLLKSNFERTPWVTRIAREVVATSDWLASHAPEEATDA